jgi:hypothetical protein
MMFGWNPLYRCHTCGKRLEEGEGIEVWPSRNPKFFNLAITCTNPRCKNFKKRKEYRVPFRRRG